MNYRLAYAIGFHPWEDLADHPPFADKLLELVAREEDGTGPPYGRALDLGTGSAVWGVRLALRGWEVTGIDIVDAALRRAARRADEAGAQVRLVQGDVTCPEEINEMFDKVKMKFGRLDIFVSNARPEGSKFFQPPLDISLEQWDTAFDSQCKAFLVGVREALPLMQDGGRIFAITYAEGSRTGGHQPWVAMGAAKAALESLVRYLAVAVAKRGITVNAISPGWTEDSVLNTLPERHRN